MLAAEGGADYVMFGEPDDGGERPGFEAIEERVTWWAEVFEAPCVGYAATMDEVAPLVFAGADFVALGDWLWREPQHGRRDRLARAAAAAALAGDHGMRTGGAALSRRCARSAWRCRARLRAQACRNLSRPLPAADKSKSTLAYGAFQRGLYLTALAEASERAQQNDPAAMTLLGELYANGLGVGRDDSKAAQWYKLAAAHGDRDAMFALAMFNLEGRAGPRNDGRRRPSA